MRRVRRLVPVLLVLLILLMAQVRPAPSVEATTYPFLAVPPSDFLALAEQIPGFMGLHRENDGVIVSLRPGSPEEVAVRVVSEALTMPVTVRVITWEFADLHRWHTYLGSYDGYSSSGVDGRAARIRFHLLTTDAKERMERAMREAGIPGEAVILDLPPDALDARRPLEGCMLGSMPPEGGKEQPYHLRLEPVPVRPGQGFELWVEDGPADLIRGVDAYLECWDGDEWSPRFTLFSRGPSALVFSKNMVLTQEAYSAAAPGRFRLPERLSPGWYRVRLRVLNGTARHLSHVIRVR